MQMLLRSLAVSTLLLLVQCTPQTALVGSGIVTSDIRPLPAVHTVRVGSALSVHILRGSGETLVVRGDDNLVPHVRTQVHGGRLEIDCPQPYTTNHELVVELALTQLENLIVEGSANVSVSGLAQERWQGELSGAAQLQIGGVVRQVELELTGAAICDGRGLQAERVKLVASGASQCDLAVETALAVKASGAARVTYAGKCHEVDIATRGAATVVARE